MAAASDDDGAESDDDGAESDDDEETERSARFKNHNNHQGNRKKRQMSVKPALASLALINYLLFGAFLFQWLDLRPTQGLTTNLDQFATLLSSGGDAATAAAEIRSQVAQTLWNITNQLNILYEANWTRLVTQELAKFEQKFLKIASTCGELGETGTGDSQHRKTSQQQQQEPTMAFGAALVEAFAVSATIRAPQTIVAFLYATFGAILLFRCVARAGQWLARRFCALAVRCTCGGRIRNQNQKLKQNRKKVHCNGTATLSSACETVSAADATIKVRKPKRRDATCRHRLAVICGIAALGVYVIVVSSALTTLFAPNIATTTATATAGARQLALLLLSFEPTPRPTNAAARCEIWWRNNGASDQTNAKITAEWRLLDGRRFGQALGALLALLGGWTIIAATIFCLFASGDSLETSGKGLRHRERQDSLNNTTNINNRSPNSLETHHTELYILPPPTEPPQPHQQRQQVQHTQEASLFQPLELYASFEASQHQNQQHHQQQEHMQLRPLSASQLRDLSFGTSCSSHNTSQDKSSVSVLAVGAPHYQKSVTDVSPTLPTAVYLPLNSFSTSQTIPASTTPPTLCRHKLNHNHSNNSLNHHHNKNQNNNGNNINSASTTESPATSGSLHYCPRLSSATSFFVNGAGSDAMQIVQCQPPTSTHRL